MICPKCGERPDHEFMGFEVATVYDGISFWQHKCGAVWSRWTGEVVPDWGKMTWEQREMLARKQRRACCERAVV
jgi:hypothetical protein